MDNTGASLKSVDKFCYPSDMLSVDVDADMEVTAQKRWNKFIVPGKWQNKLPMKTSSITSHRQPRQSPPQGPKTVKGAQSDQSYVSRLLARRKCLPGGGTKIIVTSLDISFLTRVKLFRSLVTRLHITCRWNLASKEQEQGGMQTNENSERGCKKRLLGLLDN